MLFAGVAGRGGARCHRPVAGQTQRRKPHAAGAGDAAAAIDAGRGEQAVSSFRADDDRRPADRAFPEPARPDAEAQKAGAQPALPPAPAEKSRRRSRRGSHLLSPHRFHSLHPEERVLKDVLSACCDFQCRSASALQRAGCRAGSHHAAIAGDANVDALLHVLGIVRTIELAGAAPDRAGHIIIVRRAGSQRRRGHDDSDDGAHGQRSPEGAFARSEAMATAPGLAKSTSQHGASGLMLGYGTFSTGFRVSRAR